MRRRILELGRPVHGLSRRWLATGKHPQDYLNETVIPTFHFQDSLPKLPIPPLEKTAQRYIYSATPLISESELATTKKLMQEFTKGVGAQLHKTIVERDKKLYSSYISKPWFDMYLETRSPLILNINPQITFISDPNPAKMTHAVRAATLIWSSVRFFRTYVDGQLEPDMFHTKACMGGSGEGFFKFLNGKGGDENFQKFCALLPRKFSFYGAYIYGTYPLDMSQYEGLFQSTRIPKVGKDELKKFPNSKHIIIQRGSNFYKLDVLRPDGSVVPGAEILSEIECMVITDKLCISEPKGRQPLRMKILAVPTAEVNKKPPIGVLTTMDRDDWGRARAELLAAGPGNAEALEAVDSALFAVCLEDEAPTRRGLLDAQRCMLHGAGRNRWFDKSFQLIVAADGRASVCFEHSWGDGVAVLRYFNESCEDALEAPAFTPAPARSPAAAVDFVVSPAVQAAVAAAEKAVDALMNSYDADMLEIPGFTADYIKSHGLGLDGALQMSFQLAHYKMYGHTASTYESANQSAYKHGRTETIRSATPESDNMCRVFADSGSSRGAKEGALRQAVRNHGRLTKEALMGGGWDRHMFAMRMEARAQGLPLPAIYQDKAYQVLSEVILSTSTLSSPNIDGGGFGPVGPRCYGIGYTTGKLRGERDKSAAGRDGFACSVTSFKRDTSGFIDALRRAVGDIQEVLGS